MTLSIDLKTHTLRVKPTAYGLSHPPGADAEPVYGPRELWYDFMQRGVAVKAPRFSPSGEDLRIAVSLLRKYPLDKMPTYVRLFWTRYSQPLFEGGDHPMRLFAASIPKIRAELGEED